MDIQTADKQRKKWVEGKSHIQSKLFRDELSKPYEFLNIHAASEAALRRTLFVGLKLNKVTYEIADRWLHHNDLTPGKSEDRGSFIYNFNRLYPQNWETTLHSVSGLEELWELWNGFSKGIRNHIAHGMRRYSDEWINPAIIIDRLFIIRLDEAISPSVGGSPFASLVSLSPRLPRGESLVDPIVILNAKGRKPQPKIPLTNVIKQVGRL